MTWQQTHRREERVRSVEAALAHDPRAVVVWTEDDADLFGDVTGLRRFLRHRWELRLARDVRHDPEPPRQHPALRAATLGLAVLDAHPERVGVPSGSRGSLDVAC
ncbi:hypothetical protein [Nocardioides sp.]|uniref:hypothetical protein n=1 Tax=Nocardioides sp. TaxID=35761 RepID=UPI0035183BFC